MNLVIGRGNRRQVIQFPALGKLWTGADAKIITDNLITLMRERGVKFA